MEELIWKYIDNSCNKEEEELVQRLLDSDPKFKIQFDAIYDLNTQLINVAFVQMNEAEKIKMSQNIVNELAILRADSKIEILPGRWILGLSVVALSILIYAFTIPENSEVWLEFLPSVDDKIISIAGWISLSFIMLTILDLGLKRIHEIRKFTGLIA